MATAEDTVGDSPSVSREPTESGRRMLFDGQALLLHRTDRHSLVDETIFIAITSLNAILGHRKHVLEIRNPLVAMNAAIGVGLELKGLIK